MVRILVVDDEAAMREALSERLATFLSSTVSSAGSGNEAIKLIEQGNKFDLIVSDYSMADGNGAELLRYVTEKNVFTLFVLFSGSINFELPPTNGLFLGIVEKTNINDLFDKITYGICMAGSLLKKNIRM